MKNFHRIAYGNVSKALRKHLDLDFLHENTFFHPKQLKCIAKGSKIFWNSTPPLFIGKKVGAFRPEASWGRFLSAPQWLSSPPFSYFTVGACLMEVFRIWFSSFFSSLSPMLSEICLPKVFGNFMEGLRKPRKPRKPFFNKTWRSLSPSCFFLKQPNFQIVPEGPRFELLFTPHLDKYTLVFVSLAVFFPKSHKTLRIPLRWVLSLPKRSTMVLGWN